MQTCPHKRLPVCFVSCLTRHGGSIQAGRLGMRRCGKGTHHMGSTVERTCPCLQSLNFCGANTLQGPPTILLRTLVVLNVISLNPQTPAKATQMQYYSSRRLQQQALLRNDSASAHACMLLTSCGLIRDRCFGTRDWQVKSTLYLVRGGCVACSKNFTFWRLTICDVLELNERLAWTDAQEQLNGLIQARQPQHVWQHQRLKSIQMLSWFMQEDSDYDSSCK